MPGSVATSICCAKMWMDTIHDPSGHSAAVLPELSKLARVTLYIRLEL